MPERRDQRSDRRPDYASLLVMIVVLMVIFFAIGALALERVAATEARSMAVVVVVCLSPLLFLGPIVTILYFANPRLANFVDRMLGMLFNTEDSEDSAPPPVPATQRRDLVPTSDLQPDYASLLVTIVVVVVISFVAGALAMESVAATGTRSLGLAVLVCLAPMLLLVPGAVIAYFVSLQFADFANRVFGVSFNGEDPMPVRPVDPNSTVGKLSRTLDALQDTVKDAILDFGVSTKAAPKPVSPPPLPEMAQGEFVAMLRPRVDEVLARMAEEINKAPTGNVIDAGKDRVHPLLEELEHEGLIQGLRLRIDAAYAALPKERRPQGDWARKYRIMVSG